MIQVGPKGMDRWMDGWVVLILKKLNVQAVKHDQ
jgi:hypothetical protein